MLSDFPQGYRLYTRVKRVDGKTMRRDTYLLGESFHVMTLSLFDLCTGSTTPGCRRFKSPNEIYLHFLWLARNRPLNDIGRPKCKCCNCSGRGQSIINREMTNWLV